MKKKLTGLLAILLAASMALGGCSSNTETQSTEPSSGEEPTEQAESTEEPEDASDLSGEEESTGLPEDFTMWSEDAEATISSFTEEPKVIRS